MAKAGLLPPLLHFLEPLCGYRIQVNELEGDMTSMQAQAQAARKGQHARDAFELRSVGRSVGRTVGRLVGWWVGRLVGWSVGWLVGWSLVISS